MRTRAGLTLYTLFAAGAAGVAQVPPTPPGGGSTAPPTAGGLTVPPMQPRQVTAAPGGVPAAAAPLAPQLEAHLAAWQARNAGVTNLYTECEMVRENVLLRKSIKYAGSVVCMKPNLARMRIDNKDPLKKGDFLSYICDGTALYEYVGGDAAEGGKVVVKHPIPAGGKGGVGDNLLLEFMSGLMTADDIKQRFDLRLEKEEEFYVHIEVKPRLPKDRQEFDKMTLVLYGPKAAAHKLDYLPAVVVMNKGGSGQEVERWTFTKSMPNVAGIKKEDFAFVKPPEGWAMKAAAPQQAADPRVARPSGGK